MVNLFLKQMKTPIVPIFLLAGAVELLTVGARFGLGLESTRDTASTVGPFTFGIRVHHGYVGLLAVLLSAWVASRPSTANWLRIIGWALIVSDLAHHFVVLRFITGSHQFDLFYPE